MMFLFNFSIYLWVEIEREREIERGKRENDLPGDMGRLVPQNSTVSFKKELGKQW